jgi:uncharacterized membrane protein YfcA
VILLTSVAAYLIKGLVGFGPALITIPVLTWLVGFKEAIIIGTLADIVSGMLILILDRRKIDFKIVAIVEVGMLIGSAVGVSFLTVLPVEILKKIFGVILIIIVITNMINMKNHVFFEFNRWKGFAIGLLAGFVGGLINTNGPVLILYLKHVIKDNRVLRTNLATILFIDALWRALLMSQSGLFDLEPLRVFGLAVLPGVLMGIGISQKLHRHTHYDYLKYLTEVLLLIFAGGLLIK